MKKRVVILGSTGSIGRNTLDVIDRHPDRFEVWGLAARRNIDCLAKQVEKYHPKVVAVFDPVSARTLRQRLQKSKLEIYSGLEGLIQVATMPEIELVVSAVIGSIGLLPNFAALRAGKTLALANKETMVMAGELAMQESLGRGTIIPIDSEHSAIFQVLNGEKQQYIRRIILTASGGPFRTLPAEKFDKITVKEALQHPNWQMGKKITIDSATLMNKGLEVIEARWLFQVELSQIDVLIHPQSIIHSMVEFVDGSVLAQMGIPDMRLPIAYALNYPERLENSLTPLDLTRIGSLTFEPPDTQRFPCLRYAVEALKIGGTMPAVLNAANEVAVEAFLQEQIRFTQIAEVIAETMAQHHPTPLKTGDLHDILAADTWARRTAQKLIQSLQQRRF
ncbi:MAG: 1-deoxy-D-xylulose-5-phosphate reductoisomerase [Nitrospinota bacterium]|nr:MAG: 1-deoxy-D-xylulose-5-phosphate reductoisomerase [Nitrospinota bacterium]